MTNGITGAVPGRVWSGIGVAIGLLIVVIAGAALFRLLRDIDLDEVVAAVRAKSVREVVIAGGFVLAGYVTLTLYDFFALRTIGRNTVPYRIAALAGFTSYAIGHNLGATVFTGGAIRFRIYSAWGLSIIDVAKIAFVTGLTFWLGNAFLLGFAMSYAPVAASAVNQLPAWVNRGIGLSGLMFIVGYLIWLMPRPRVVGRSDWRIVLPGLRLTVVQIGIGVLDLTLGALAMYMLLPDHPSIDFITLLVIFVTATLLGFLSHAPGSLGVFEAAMLVGLPLFQKEGLLASLLIFRLLYFVFRFFSPRCCSACARCDWPPDLCAQGELGAPLEINVSGRDAVVPLPANVQRVLEFLQPRLVFVTESLNFTIERLKLAFVGCHLRRELIVENMDLLAENLESLLDLGKAALARDGRALLASVNLVKPGGQRNEACHRHNDREPQSCIPITHTAQLQGILSTSSNRDCATGTNWAGGVIATTVWPLVAGSFCSRQGSSIGRARV